MWAAVVYSDPAYHRSLRKLSLTVRVKSHTHPCMCLPMLLSLKRIYLRCPLYLSLASFHTCFIAFLLSFSPSLPLPATFNSLFYFRLFLSAPCRSFFLLLRASFGCEQPLCSRFLHALLIHVLRYPSGIILFFYLEECRIKPKTEEQKYSRSRSSDVFTPVQGIRQTWVSLSCLMKN